jgi:iron complex outermembrane receptor protein
LCGAFLLVTDNEFIIFKVLLLIDECFSTIKLKLIITLTALLSLSVIVQRTLAQSSRDTFSLTVTDQSKKAIDGATVKLIHNGVAQKTTVSNAVGIALFANLPAGAYAFSVTYTGYKAQLSRVYDIPTEKADTVRLQAASTTLQEVSIVGKTPAITQQQGKTIVNVGASVTNEGATVLEVLEKSPGVTVDRNGGISLQGKPGVMVMIDDKPTYLSGTDLANLLTSMSSTQVQQIELITTPGAKYDASGNAGIINIKTKKNKVKGFNGTFTTSYGQGRYPKNNNSLILNYRVGRINTFFNYSLNYIKSYFDIYAYRKYSDANNNVTSTLDQYSFLPSSNLSNIIKTGLDYSVTDKTTIGFVVSGFASNRHNGTNATANWLNPAGGADSTILTSNNGTNRFRNGAINVNLRQNISEGQDIAADFDYLHYSIQSQQNYRNDLQAPGGYAEIYRGDIPTTINIRSGKVDYSRKLSKTSALQIGWKSSLTNTDNLATYQNLVNNQWLPDSSKTNHFVYKENIHALYSSVEHKSGKLSGQLGLRYEATKYNAHQLGNGARNDTAFSRNYGQFFPSGYLSLQADTANGFTLTAGRRIDRPPFQNLNPFYFIINKYTYSTGNPLLQPQFSWNFELSHQYKDMLTTTFTYSTIKNYFSQIFLSDPTDDAILLYTQGNVGRTYNIGLSSALVLSPVKWWSVTTQATYNHKQLRGFNGNSFTTEIDQLNVNMNNQFTIAKIYTAELSGFYTTKARNDVQELLYPTGQVSVGISRPVLSKKATIRLTARDIFFTNAMEGLTSFPNATEYFILHRDSRVISISFTYRFGKTYKTAKRTGGSAADEMNRVGNG